MTSWLSGEKITCPREPADVPMPSTSDCRPGSTTFAMAASAIENEVRAMPRPVRTPPNRVRPRPVVAIAMPAVPAP